MMSIGNTLIFFIIFVLLLISVILLQVFLSKRENKWLGLILPIINFMFSLLVIISFPLYTNQSITECLIALIIPFSFCNIPTIILIAIYFACREKFKKKKGLDKMNIQDLE